MSDLVYQNYNNKCKGWVNPSLSFEPEIISLTGYQSPAGSNTVISIIGNNFYSYSAVNFGTFTPTVYFINSSLISFYVPNTLYPGTYPVRVCNGAVCSNIVNFTIDISSGHWLLNPSGTISNTNNQGVGMSWLSRGAPVTVNNDSTNPYSVPNNVNWIICDLSSGDVYIQLPPGTAFSGREIMFKAINPSSNSVVSQGTILDINNSSTQVIIDSTLNQWATLVCNGTNWIIMQQG